MSLDAEKRKIIVKSFRDYCKAEKWGPVNAAKALAEHLMPDIDGKDFSKEKLAFKDKWANRIEDVLYKKSTSLSKVEDAEIADYIYSFLLDNIGIDEIGISTDLFQKHLTSAFDSLVGEKIKISYFKNITNTILLINGALTQSMVVLKENSDKSCQCFVVFQNRRRYLLKGKDRTYDTSLRKHPISNSTDDLNIKYLKGVLYCNNKDDYSMDGLLVDDLKNVVFSAKISTPELTVPSRALTAPNLNAVKNKPILRIETSVPFFPKYANSFSCDQAILMGELVEYTPRKKDQNNYYRSDALETKLINELKIFSEL